MLELNHGSHKVVLSPDSLLILENATEEDYWQLANEDLKVEYDGRRLYIHSPARFEHEKFNMKLLFWIDSYLQQHPELGDVVGSRFAVRLPNGKRPEPDVVILPPGKVEPKQSVFEGIPLTVIEILSPSNYEHDVERKLLWYQEAKIPLIWYIDLDEQKFSQYRLDQDYSEELLEFNQLEAEEVVKLLFEQSG